MAEIHNGLAGRREILLRNLVKPSATLNHRAGLAQFGEVLGRHVRAATGDLRQLPHHARFAGAQFLENLPPGRVAQRRRQQIQVGQWRHGNGLLGV